MDQGFQFTYAADRVQLTFLQLLSTTAHQSITYRCHNSVAYFDQESKSFDKAAIFMTYNDLELKAKKSKFKYSVREDKCKAKNSKWSSTVFEFETNKPKRLPVLDMKLADIGRDDQKFGLTIGPVCFA
jgi:hypothetical protein